MVTAYVVHVFYAKGTNGTVIRRFGEDGLTSPGNVVSN
jgi:hypothetical protein